MRKFWLSLFMALSSCLALSACAILDLRNVYQLSKMEVLDGDAETGRVAVIWPKDIHSEDLFFDFKMMKGTEALPERIEGFILEIDPDARPLIKRPRAENLGEMQVYRLADKDIARAKDFQLYLDRIQGRTNEQKRKMEMSFYFNVQPDNVEAKRYCLDHNKRAEAPFYVWVKVADKQPYRRVIKTKSIEKFMQGPIEYVCKQLERGAGASPSRMP